jgi:hypothetical protein
MISLLQEVQPIHTEHIDLIDRLYIQPLKVSWPQVPLLRMTRLILTYVPATQRGLGAICINGGRDDRSG